MPEKEDVGSLDFSAFAPREEHNDNLLARINVAMSQWETIDNEMAELEDKLKKKKGELKHLVENELPELMIEAEQKQITTMGDWCLKLEEFVHGHVPAPSATEPDAVTRRWAAYKWLDENGHGSLIDRNLVVTFDRKDEAKAGELLKKLREEKNNVKPIYSLHHMRLQGFIRDMYDKGKDVPEDLFAIKTMKRCTAKNSAGRKLRMPKGEDE